MRGKVLVTRKCNKHCKGCKRNSRDIPLVMYEDIKKFDEIVITGGEPMLISERCVELVHRLRFQGYTGKIYLDFSDASKVGRYWGADMIIDEVDGIIFSLHYNAKKDKLKNDLRSLRKLDKYLKEHDRSGKEDILLMDSRVFTFEYAKSLTGGWKEIKGIDWRQLNGLRIEMDEEVVFYDLEAEG